MSTLTTLLHDDAVNRMHDALNRFGVQRTPAEIDNAIQGVIEHMHETDGYRPNLDNDRVWWEAEPMILERLDLEPTFLDEERAA